MLFQVNQASDLALHLGRQRPQHVGGTLGCQARRHQRHGLRLLAGQKHRQNVGGRVVE